MIGVSAFLLAAGAFVLGAWCAVAQPVPWGIYP